MTKISSQVYVVCPHYSILRLSRFCSLIILLGIFAWSFPQWALAEDPWVLSNEQRRAFLHYYSPIILKRADEDGSKGKHRGHDWITNFNFDRDGNFANNRRNWKKEKFKFIDKTAHQDWQIRPTLYTAVIEFMRDGQKSLILLYHVYHAMQGCIPRGCKNYDIHDWERIEIRLDHIDPTGPGSHETIRYHVLTKHSKHTGRLGGHEDLHYMDKLETPHPIEGKHLLVWQAKWRGLLGSRKGELRFVKEALEDFYYKKAEVEVSKSLGEKPFHYIFVDRDATSTVGFLKAKPITQETASKLASGKDVYRIIKTKKTKRITYELQDLADVFPTHWIHANGPDTKNINWKGKSTFVALDQELISTITGTPITVPVGRREFLRQARKGNRKGYPQKHWFWGTYVWGTDKTFTDDAYDERNQEWPQHDYFAQTGGNSFDPPGWLPEGWHLKQNGGFDGRWTPLFSD